jgi:hypothetical protein
MQYHRRWVAAALKRRRSYSSLLPALPIHVSDFQSQSVDMPTSEICIFHAHQPLCCAYLRAYLQDVPLCTLLPLVGRQRLQQCCWNFRAGAFVAATSKQGDTCLSLAAVQGHTAVVRQLLQAWQVPPVRALRRAIKYAAGFRHWDAVMLLVRQLGKQDMAAAAEKMRAIPAAVPALLNAVLGSRQSMRRRQCRRMRGSLLSSGGGCR